MTIDQVFELTRERWLDYQTRSTPWPTDQAGRDALIQIRRDIAKTRYELAGQITDTKQRRYWQRQFQCDMI